MGGQNQTSLHSEQYQMIHGSWQIIGQTQGQCPEHNLTNFVFVRDSTKNGLHKVCEKCLLASKLEMFGDDG